MPAAITGCDCSVSLRLDEASRRARRTSGVSPRVPSGWVSVESGVVADEAVSALAAGDLCPVSGLASGMEFKGCEWCGASSGVAGTAKRGATGVVVQGWLLSSMRVVWLGKGRSLASWVSSRCEDWLWYRSKFCCWRSRQSLRVEDRQVSFQVSNKLGQLALDKVADADGFKHLGTARSSLRGANQPFSIADNNTGTGGKSGHTAVDSACAEATVSST